MATQPATTELTSRMTWDQWAPTPLGEAAGGSQLLTGDVTNHYAGAIEGTGAFRTMIAVLPERRTTFVGLERVEGKVGGRSGSLMLQIAGGTEGGRAEAVLTVVPGSGTGELEGATGTGRYVCENPGPDGHSDVVLSLSFG